MTIPQSWADILCNQEAALTPKLIEYAVTNALAIRSELFRQLFDPRRNVDDECGYPRSETGGGFGSINPELYRTLYERELASRVVEVMPKESWQVTPAVFEDESPDTITAFEEGWDGLSRYLRGGTSYYQGELGSPIWEHLRRADILSGIAHFGVLLLGVDDGRLLEQPADGVVAYTPVKNKSTGKFIANEQGKVRLFERLVVNGRPGPLCLPSKEIDRRPVYALNEKTGLPEVVGSAPHVNMEAYAANEVMTSAGLPLGYGQSGTDAQYVGVQLSPSEYPSPQPSAKPRDLVFLRSFDESLVQIVQYEANVRNPRFGLPVMYRITLNDPREMHSGIGLPMATLRVHWSRVIHLADNLGSSEIFGKPRMRPVLNRLLDLRKLYSSGAEGYWRSCFPILSMETHPQLGGDVITDDAKIKNELENLMNTLQRQIISKGFTLNSVAPSVVDPSPQIDKQVEAVCIQLGIPKRVFMGSERGELASSQDDASWNDRLRERQNNYLTPRVIVPFIDRLIALGVLPVPGGGRPTKQLQKVAQTANRLKRRVGGGWLLLNESDDPKKNGKPESFVSDAGYAIKWPDLDSLTDKDRATIALTKVQAYQAYVQGGVEALIPPKDLFTEIMGMEEERAEALIDDAMEHHEDQETMTIPPQIQGQDAKAPEGTQAKADGDAAAEQAKQSAQMKADQFDATMDLKGKQIGAKGPPKPGARSSPNGANK